MCLLHVLYLLYLLLQVRKERGLLGIVCDNYNHTIHSYVVALTLPASAKTPSSTLSVLELDTDTTSPSQRLCDCKTNINIIYEVLLFHSPPQSPSPPRTPSRPRRAAAQTCCCHTYTVRDAGVGGEDKSTEVSWSYSVQLHKNMLSCALGLNKELYITLIHFHLFTKCSTLFSRVFKPAYEQQDGSHADVSGDIWNLLSVNSTANTDNLPVYFAANESALGSRVIGLYLNEGNSFVLFVLLQDESTVQAQ